MKLFLSHLNGAAKAHFLANRLNSAGSSGRVLFVCLKDEQETDDFGLDISTFADGKFEITSYPKDSSKLRIAAASVLSTSEGKIVVITTPEGLLAKTLSKDSLENFQLKLIDGKTYNYSELPLKLSTLGYTREKFTEDKNQFSVRGEVLDIWPSGYDMPVRINFDFNAISSIKTFESASQLSTKNYLDEVTVLSLGGNSAHETALITDYASGGKIYFDAMPQNLTELESKFKNFDFLINDPLNSKAQSAGYKALSGTQLLAGGNMGGSAGNLKHFADSIKNFISQNAVVEIFCATEGERERISDVFFDENINSENIIFKIAKLSESFYLESERRLFVSSTQALYKRKPVSFPKISGGRRLEGIWEINSGDYVVHERYGIGKYTGLKKIARAASISEYLCVEYKGGDKLYIPPQELKSVKKYIGVEGVRPKLYSMDGSAWERLKSNAREAAAEFAKELLALYARRQNITRPPIMAETIWEKELKDSFPFEETPDQLKAIADVSEDFKKPYPAERLICGDVGFGKTEVAVRAAFKIVEAGFQVAVLVPTTVLAQQHYNTFTARLAMFPTNISMLSRFQTKARQGEIVENIKKGACDIVIATHRILQKDIKFKNLGLLIIDEEHRFGVAQKEKIKKLKTNVDILMLSATPIPRTLSQSLNGIRDLSVIETPPLGRLPIETSVAPYNITLVKKIIEAELSRGGQVFYVYNEVATILNKAQEIQNLGTSARVGVIHGQMKPADIESIMWKFLNLEYDVLIATTIIESGIDIPSVNAMIIEEAENFGLSQIYQLRGRVGRDRQKAFCYLFYNSKNLTDEASKRLEAIAEFGELGSGFRLALKDLEIRGAGGLLSSSQHGFVRDVGYDMFAKLLDEESAKIRGAKGASKEVITEINLECAAFINENYIEEDDIRILFYRRLTESQTEKELSEIKAELRDRFGAPTPEIEMLFEIAGLRLQANKKGITLISEDDNYIYVHFEDTCEFKNFDIMSFIKDYPNAEFLSAKFAFKLKKALAHGKITQTMLYLKTFLDDMPKYGIKTI